MMSLLMFCHQFSYDAGDAAWWWLVPSAAVAAGFTYSLAGLVREIKGGGIKRHRG
jgi:hypothetical protein